MDIRGRPGSGIAVLLPNQLPIAPCIGGLGNPQPFDSTFFQISVGNIGRARIAQARRDRSHLSTTFTQAAFSPSCSFIICHKGGLIADNVNQHLAILPESHGDICESLCGGARYSFHTGRCLFCYKIWTGKEKDTRVGRRMWIDPQFVGQPREIPLSYPVFAPVPRRKEGKRAFSPIACGNIKSPGIRWIDCHRSDAAQGVRLRNQIFVRMI